MEESSLRYGGLWIRLAALLLDGVIFFAGLMVLGLIGSAMVVRLRGEDFPAYSLFAFCIWVLEAAFYHIFLVRKFGGTPGKLICGLRVRKVNGAPVGYREAFARYCPSLTLLVLSGACFLVAVSHTNGMDFLKLSDMDRFKLYPEWIVPVGWCQLLWVWAELIVFSGNWKRRALHDFIGHTVVTYAASENGPPPLPLHEEWPPESAS